MHIHIQDLSFETIVGILEEERHTPQKVVLHVKIDYTYTENNFIDYAKVASFLESTMQEMAYFLLEDALNDLMQKLKILYPQMDKIKLKILKPSILPNAIVGVSQSLCFKKN
ncbi:dihydroneopterin aldolase [Sulfurospirillum barnesii]|uniref:FolB domain protein n=1 Tax=Sulfurospirillum barnesii (strain ATCC 700032 / DSM 10660 / SES-3) TaxID=760154 RepID=I3XUF7_SULBS|nr:dihydroneopterin aldolase [Sulfurospirillum barnesii]AFL67581.1 FolB domain protein [Sulfurospirillum barnesii SES-3]